jgi:hypothetical protein
MGSTSFAATVGQQAASAAARRLSALKSSEDIGNPRGFVSLELPAALAEVEFDGTVGFAINLGVSPEFGPMVVSAAAGLVGKQARDLLHTGCIVGSFPWCPDGGQYELPGHDGVDGQVNDGQRWPTIVNDSQ